MKYLNMFERFFAETKKKHPKIGEDFKGKRNTYQYSNIHDVGNDRRGVCKKCGKEVSIITHQPSINNEPCTEKTD